MNQIEVSLSQEKINFINNIYQKGSQYWKVGALKKALGENEANELKNVAPSSSF